MASSCSESKANGPIECSVSYTLFLYREELRRRNARFLKLSKTKIHLTDELISKTVRNITDCTVEDLQNLSREMVFKKKLKHQLQRIRKLQQLGIRNPDPRALTTTSL